METPEHIAKYRILRLLGQGAMGRVFLAEDPMIDRKVAIKVMSVEGDEEARQRFRQEARTVGQLSHPNIVHLYDFGFHEGAPYLVMEYLEGESLDRWLLHSPPLDRKLAVLLDLCRATAHAHARGVLHRDIKPSNLQVLGDGSAKLLDFGIARAKSVGLTATGTILGTPQFMAPEVLRDAGYAVRSDVYAVGLVVYEALAGVNPFRADTLEGCLTRVLTHEPPPLESVADFVPAELSDLVGSYLDKDPDQRPADLAPLEAALRDLLGRVVSGGVAAQMTATFRFPSAAPAPSTGSEAAPASPSRLPLAAAALAAVLAAAALAVWGPWRSETVVPPPEPAASALQSVLPEAKTDEPPGRPEEEPPPVSVPTTIAQAPTTTPPARRPAEPAPKAETPPQEARPPGDSPEERNPPPVEASPPEAVSTGGTEEELQPAGPPPPLPTTTSTAPPVVAAPPEPEPPAPRIDDISPKTVRRGSNAVVVKITGDGFGPGAQVVIRRGTEAVEEFRLRLRKSHDETEMHFTILVSQQMAIGTYHVVVIGADGQESPPVPFEVSL